MSGRGATWRENQLLPITRNGKREDVCWTYSYGPIDIDLQITDVGLPGGMNGRQIADAAHVLRPMLKVLFITGYAENAVVGNGHLEKGMQIVTKPFAMDDLARKIRDIIES